MNAGVQTKQKQEKAAPAEDWEIETVQRLLPQYSESDIKSALNDCKRELGSGAAREKMMRCVESKLK